MESPEDILAEMQPRLTHAEVAANNQMFREATERIKTLTAALEALLDAVENDGTLIHSDRCGCEICEALKQANTVADAAPPTSSTECERLREACRQALRDLETSENLWACDNEEGHSLFQLQHPSIAAITAALQENAG